ncbi:hypothetical protein N9O57_01190, partial [bacterium]|nr:hypothetical protein [bacterium]
ADNFVTRDKMNHLAKNLFDIQDNVVFGYMSYNIHKLLQLVRKFRDYFLAFRKTYDDTEYLNFISGLTNNYAGITYDKAACDNAIYGDVSTTYLKSPCREIKVSYDKFIQDLMTPQDQNPFVEFHKLSADLFIKKENLIKIQSFYDPIINNLEKLDVYDNSYSLGRFSRLARILELDDVVIPLMNKSEL